MLLKISQLYSIICGIVLDRWATLLSNFVQTVVGLPSDLEFGRLIRTQVCLVSICWKSHSQVLIFRARCAKLRVALSRISNFHKFERQDVPNLSRLLYLDYFRSTSSIYFIAQILYDCSIWTGNHRITVTSVIENGRYLDKIRFVAGWYKTGWWSLLAMKLNTVFVD